MKVTSSQSPFHSFVTLTSYRDINLLRTGLLTFVAAHIPDAGIALFKLGIAGDSGLPSWHLEESSIQAPDAIRAGPILAQLQAAPVNEVETTLQQNGLNAFPLHRKGSLSGALVIECPALDATTCHSVHALLAIYSNQLFWLDRSSHDALTGLLNRHMFDERIAQLALQHEPGFHRRDADYAADHEHHVLGIIDIDFFKKINDQFGHLYGDEVLVHLAHCMRSSFRDSDWLFRFGGEEFVVLMRNVERDTAQQILERFRSRVAARPFAQVGHISVSIGFCQLNPATALISLGQADKALYYAKANGRNRCCEYEALLRQGELQVAAPQSGEIDLF